jgi:drug/metabolite transporter (DMT)-like permease
MTVGILCMAGVVALWSVIPVLAKFVMRTFDPFTLAFLRLFQGTVVCALLHVARGGSVRSLLRVDRWVAVGAAGLTVNYLFFSLSLYLASASAGTLIVQSQSVFLAVFAAIFLKEPLVPRKLIGLAAVMGGVFLVLGSRVGLGAVLDPNEVTGNLVMLAAAAGWGVYALSNRALADRRSSLEILVPIMGLGSLATGVAAAARFQLKAPILLPTAAAAVVLGALATGIGFFLLAEGLKRLSAALVGTLTGVTPLGSILMAWAFLGERPGWQILAAAALIVAGILFGTLAEREAARRLPADAASP